VPQCRQQRRPAIVHPGNDGVHLPERVGIHLAAHRNDMRSAALGVRIEESNDPSELVPDHLLPVQFTELLQRPSERTPEHKLMAAVLEEAIRTFCRCAGAPGARCRRLFREAAEWFASHDVSWPFAFANVCEALALEPEWIRRALQRWQARHATEGAGLPTLRLRVAGSRHAVNGRAPGLPRPRRWAC